MTVAMPVIGLFGINMGPCATAEGAVRIARLAEELGYESLWTAEHAVLPSPRVRPSPMQPDYPITDPLVALALLAGVTRRVRLATGIIILPQRNPVVLAKELASLDVLSGGRLIFGMGVGYLEPEMRAIGVAMSGRGARSDEYLQAMRALWEDPAPAYRGRHVEFAGVDAYPRPLQRPVPVMVGGHGDAAYRRTVRYGAGWYGFMQDRRGTAAHIDALRKEAAATGRDFGELNISVTPAEELDSDVVRDYAELGVHRLVVMEPAARRRVLPLPELETFVRANAPERVGGTPADA